MLHSDMVVAVTESEYRVDFSVIDSKGQSHSGFIETANGKVVHAVIDGRVFFSER
jgi:hypothetical protein